MRRTPEEEQAAVIIVFLAMVAVAVLITYLIAAGY